MRGLKPTWSLQVGGNLCRIFYRCVDWNIFIGLGYARPLVASFTDAWIETRCCLCEDSCRESHLLQMRGLKLTFAVENSIWKVASFTDAWIETVRMRLYITLIFGRIFYRCVDWNLCSNGALLASTSHLLQMRGLKHCPQKEYNNPIMSHLLQMRGLKRNQPYKHYRPRQVASFTDAWIETYQSAGVFSQCQSHLLQMRGLKRPF